MDHQNNRLPLPFYKKFFLFSNKMYHFCLFHHFHTFFFICFCFSRVQYGYLLSDTGTHLPLCYIFSLIYSPLLSSPFIFHPPDFRCLRCIIALSSPCRPDRCHPSGEGAGRLRGGERRNDGGTFGEKHSGLVMDENTRRHSNDSALFPN